MPGIGDRVKTLPTQVWPPMAPSGGRTWWAHVEFTRINIQPTFLYKKIEELRQLGAFTLPVAPP
jgi:hypothetical protein